MTCAAEVVVMLAKVEKYTAAVDRSFFSCNGEYYYQKFKLIGEILEFSMEYMYRIGKKSRPIDQRTGALQRLAKHNRKIHLICW